MFEKIRESGVMHQRPKDILLKNNKTYQKYAEGMDDGTYKAMLLQKNSEMAVNSERFSKYMKQYEKIGYVMVIFTVLHVIMAPIALLSADFILYGAATVAVIMMWYAFYSKKSAFVIPSVVTVVLGIMIDLALRYTTVLMVWGVFLTVLLISVSPAVLILNREYIYLSKQEGFPHFKPVLEEEVEKNQKALKGKINLYYANMTAPEGKLGDMDELEFSQEVMEAHPDSKNDLMDTI